MHKSVLIKSRENINEKLSNLDLKIYDVLVKNGPITRSEMTRMTGIARSTLYDSLLRLALKGLAKKYSDADHNSRGRPKVFFEAILKL
ncbi:MAG: helix-turn-helix domain-containing protein [Candidatus Heimdallarchaeota archaeon]